ncbi:hypothetical protein FJTKL_08098 [Diaporthe vaccinii]|uniref:Uncharacterized protein n=1 Tax=Diaporthe vaccinii TaxID=105482 RepID=A0ABR4ESK3_9PEZI
MASWTRERGIIDVEGHLTVAKGQRIHLDRVPASFSYPKSILSILAVHNESANIWSHLLGALWFLTNTVHFLKQTNSTSFRSQDALFVALYQLCISICFILSTFYHTFSDNSPAIHRFGNELDHLGIVLVMWGTGVSGTHLPSTATRPCVSSTLHSSP